MIRLFLSALLLSSCVGLPDRLELTAGRGQGEFTAPTGNDWEGDTAWAAATLSFPITYGRAESRRWPLPPPQAPIAAAPVAAAPSVAKLEDAEEGLGMAQRLAILIGGGVVVVGAIARRKALSS